MYSIKKNLRISEAFNVGPNFQTLLHATFPVMKQCDKLSLVLIRLLSVETCPMAEYGILFDVLWQ